MIDSYKQKRFDNRFANLHTVFATGLRRVRVHVGFQQPRDIPNHVSRVEVAGGGRWASNRGLHTQSKQRISGGKELLGNSHDHQKRVRAWQSQARSH